MILDSPLTPLFLTPPHSITKFYWSNSFSILSPSLYHHRHYCESESLPFVAQTSARVSWPFFLIPVTIQKASNAEYEQQVPVKYCLSPPLEVHLLSLHFPVYLCFRQMRLTSNSFICTFSFQIKALKEEIASSWSASSLPLHLHTHNFTSFFMH